MNAFRRMLSSSKDVSFGRILAFLCILFVMGMCLYVVRHMAVKAFPVVDPFWRDMILGLYGITKTGEAAEAIFKKKEVSGES